MKKEFHIGWLILWGLVLAAVGWHLNEWFYVPSKTVTVKKRGRFDILTFKLPNSHDPDVFGAPTWEARHFLAEWTPCPGCRSEAVSHEKFFHDYVNLKTEKKLYDKQNYDKWVKKICESKEEKKS